MNLHDDHEEQSPVLARRQVLRSATALGLLGLAGMPLLARARAQVLARGEYDPDELKLDDLLADPNFVAVCTLLPSQTEGPYYLPLDIIRQDITEGLPGIRIGLRVNVVRTSDCAPVPNAIVDVWHANTPGNYSGFQTQVGQTYMRGIQPTDANGQATFLTTYPGWYPGRTHHIHVKVRPSGGGVVTSQFYFDQRFNERINRIAPYSSHGQATTTNAMDGIYNAATQLPLVALLPVPTFEFTAGIP
jgi:protocatechuate 3,4-dioxygenase beta subunit